MKNDWDDKTIMKFACLLRGKEILWNEKHNDPKKRLWYEALQDISKRMKSPHINTTPSQLVKKMSHLKHIYLEEIMKVKRDPSYKPDMIWFPVVDHIFNKTNIEKGLKANPNTSEGESSNQSASKGETVDGTDDISSEDIPTQLYVHNNQEHLGEAPTVLPDDISSHPFAREEQSFQNPDDSSFAIRHDETDVVQDETPNGMDFITGGIDDTLVSFGNYLVSLLRRLPLDKSYQLQQKFISETMNTTIQFEKERTLLLQKKRKNEVNQIHDRFYTPTPLPPRLEHSRVDGLSKKGIANRNNTFDPFSISQKTGQALRPNKMYNSGGGHNLYGGNRDTTEISIETVAEGVSGGLEVHSEDNRVMCVQCDVCKELFRTSAELRRHQAAKHPDEKNESLNREEVASKRLRLEDRALTSPMSSTFIIPGRPNSSASDRSH